MHGTATVGWLLTALCAVTGGTCLLRARGAGGMQRQAARGEALMGLGMAVMALSGSVPVSVPPLAFAAFFAAVAARELVMLWRPAGPGRQGWPAGAGHCLHHLVGSLAMVYMALAMHAAPAGGASGHGAHAHTAAAGAPLLTGALLAYFAVYVLRGGLRLLPAGPPPVVAAAGGADDAPVRGEHAAGGEPPGLAAACRLAMATGMLAMLLLML